MSNDTHTWVPTADAVRIAANTAIAIRAEAMMVWDRWDRAVFSALKSTAVLVSGPRQITIIVPYVLMGHISQSPITAEEQANMLGTVVADLTTDTIGELPDALVTYEGAGVTLLTWGTP